MMMWLDFRKQLSMFFERLIRVKGDEVGFIRDKRLRQKELLLVANNYTCC